MALALIVLGARVFVTALEDISAGIGFDPRLFALIIAPIATELPEKFNSVLWVRTGKDTLAMGNITGAMVFQACFPTAIGILFTSWVFTAENALSFASAGAAILATAAHPRPDAPQPPPCGCVAAHRRADLRHLHHRRPGPPVRAVSEEAGRILPAGAETPYRPRVPAGEENAVLKQETSTGVQPLPRSTAGLWAFFRGELVPLDQARI